MDKESLVGVGLWKLHRRSGTERLVLGGYRTVRGCRMADAYRLRGWVMAQRSYDLR